MAAVWIDANVVLRFISGDPPDMAARALELMKRAESGEVELRLSHLVLAEIVWVLASYYNYPKMKIADVLISFITADGILAEEGEILITALNNMANKNVDFVDAYLAARAFEKGEAVCSFDRDFKKLDVAWVVP